MDPVSHGLVGAVAALATVSDPKRVRMTMVCGALAAMAPDLDVLIHRTTDPLYQLEFHRQFSHSLIFVPLGSLIVASLLWWAARSRQSGFGQLYLACLAGTATAGFLDACTSYGTQLLWPFSSARLAWNLTPVVEPIFTLVLLLLAGGAWKTGRRTFGAVAGLWIALFLMHGAVQQNRALEAARKVQESRGHHPAQVLVKPTLGNQILWRVNYIQDGRLYADAVRTGFLSTRVYEGESSLLVSVRSDFANQVNTRLYGDLERFSRLSQGYLIRHPDQPEVIGDGRYAMLPNSLAPLWGLKLQPQNPEAAPSFVTFRDSGQSVRQTYWAMLRGRPDPARARLQH